MSFKHPTVHGRLRPFPPARMFDPSSLSTPTPGDLPRGWSIPVVEALRRGTRFRWPLVGASMHPTLRAGTWIELEPIRAAEALCPGQVVMYLRDDRFVVHRLIAPLGGRRPTSWLLQGDGLRRPDPPVPTQAILARVVRAWDGDRAYWPSPRTRLLTGWWILRGRVLALAVHHFSGFSGLRG